MLIEGVEVAARHVAALALRLHRAGELDLALTLGFAVDRNRPELRLTLRNRTALLHALENRSDDDLSELKQALQPSPS